MSQSLVRKLEKSLAVGSLSELVRTRQVENIWLLLDTSGSMGESIGGGKKRIHGLRETAQALQSERAMPIIQFGNGHEPSVITNERIPDPCGGTPMALAIDLAIAQKAGRIVIISDGCPDSQGAAMESAARFGGRIDVVFVGRPGEYGESFLKKLAESTGGESFTGDLSKPKEISSGIMRLLNPPADDDDDEED